MSVVMNRRDRERMSVVMNGRGESMSVVMNGRERERESMSVVMNGRERESERVSGYE